MKQKVGEIFKDWLKWHYKESKPRTSGWIKSLNKKGESWKIDIRKYIKLCKKMTRNSKGNSSLIEDKSEEWGKMEKMNWRSFRSGFLIQLQVVVWIP